ncbi:MAG: cohesin domain-containing protein [Anaerovoracaceae bacterium]
MKQNRKKAIALITVICMILTMFPMAVYADGNAFTVSKTIAKANDQVEVTFTQPTEVLMSGMTLKVSFDNSKFEATEVSATNYPNADNVTVPTATEATTAGYVELAYTSATAAANVTVPTDSKILTLKLKVKEGALSGNTQIKVETYSVAGAYDAGSYSFEDITPNDAVVGEKTRTVEIVTELTGDFPITITAPAKGATPQSTVAEGTGYTGTITWDGSPSVFAPETTYSAKVELTSKTGYVFASDATASVAGSSSITEKTVADDGSKLSFKVSFPATLGADALGGTVSITGTPKYDETLTADTSSLDYGTESLGTLSYQWKRGGVDISGAESNTYKLTVDDIGKNITVEVTNSNNSGSVTSVAVGPVAKLAYTGTEAVQAEVTKTSNTVTVTNVQSGQEYAITGGGWQDNGEFTGLAANTNYTVSTRVKATATTEASAIKTTSVTTDKLTQTISGPDSVSVVFGGSLDLNTKYSTNAASAGSKLTYTQTSTPPAGASFNGVNGVVTAGTTAGSFTVKISADEKGTFAAAADKTITVNIEAKQTQAFATDFVTSVNKVYGDEPYTKTATLSKGDGAISYESNNTGVAEVTNDGVVTIKGQGLATITATAAETANYAEATTSYTLNVSKREVAITWSNYENRVYNDGKVVEATITNKVGTDDVSINVTGGAETNAGTGYTATAVLTGTGAENYKLPTEYTKTYSIAKAMPTGTPAYTKITEANKTLDDAVLVIGSLQPDAATYKLEWVGDDGVTPLGLDTVVEKNKAYKWLFTPADTANYETLTGTITPYYVAPAGGGNIPPVQKPTIEAGEGVKVTLSADGTKATITVEEGYELTDVVLNGVSKGKVTEVTGLKTGDKLVVTAEKQAPAGSTKEEIQAQLKDQTLVARSKVVTMKNGKKAVKITWYNENGEMMDFDGVEIFRSTKRYSGFGKAPLFDTEKDAYYNTAVKAGTKYFYKVRGYVEFEGEKIYTEYSMKAIRTVK